MNLVQRIVGVALPIVLASAALAAQTPSPATHAVAKAPSCSQAANTQTDLDQCAGKELQQAEARLAAMLKRLAIDSSRPEQKAWEAYRDAQLKAIYPPVSDPRGEYGSVYPMCYANLKRKLTENRIRDLKAAATTETDPCQGYHAGGGKE